MIILFSIIAGGLLAGIILMWLSGYFIGKSTAVAHLSALLENATLSEKLPEDIDVLERATLKNQQLKAETSTLKTKIEALESELKEAKSIQTNGEESKETKQRYDSDDTEENISLHELKDSDAVQEIAKLSSTITQLEGERDKAHFDIDNLKEEIEQLKKKAGQAKPLGLPKPPPNNNSAVLESEAIDNIQVKLDMEKVAHQKTREELDQLKKIAAVKVASGPSKEKSARFKTMAIGMRSPVKSGPDNNLLKESLDKVMVEKDKVESELERVKKQLQLLKMRK